MREVFAFDGVTVFFGAFDGAFFAGACVVTFESAAPPVRETLFVFDLLLDVPHGFAAAKVA